jgi:hypothetical protein
LRALRHDVRNATLKVCGGVHAAISQLARLTNMQVGDVRDEHG